jgi:branched-chain amino acid transport system permease protein
MAIWLSYLNEALIIGILAMSVNVLIGYSGILSIASVATGGVSGYLAGYLSAAHGWSFLPCLTAGVASGILVGILLSLPSLRLSGEYVLMLTLAFASVVVSGLIAVPALGGQNGLLGIMPVHIGSKVLLRPADLLELVVPATAICLAICWRIIYSPFGRVLKGIREEPDAVRALGKNVFAYQVVAFAASSAIAAVGGVILVFYNQLASPTLFDFNAATLVIAIAVIGGLGNLWGSLVGAVLLVGLQPVLEKVVAVDPNSASLWQMIVYGLLLLIIVRIRPEGLIPETASVRKLARRIRGRQPDKDPAAAGADASEGQAGVLDGAAAAVASAPGNGEAIVAAATLKAHGLEKHFGGIRAVSNLDIELTPGRITALVGPNGAGKTTVFNLLTGQINPDAGEVELDGNLVSGLPPHRVVLRGMARSFQDVRTFRRLTALENVMLAVPEQTGEDLVALMLRPFAVRRRERETRKLALECLGFVGLLSEADERAGNLSYGSQKLLAVARLLATGCDVLLIDEPAAGIDREALEPVMQVMERLRASGKTICLVEHNLEVVTRLADHVLFIEDGRVTETGTMDEIRQQPRLATVYFGHHNG